MTVPSAARRDPGSGRGVPARRLPAGCWWSGAGGLLGAIALLTALTLGRARGAAWSAEHPAAPVLTVIPMPSPTPLPAVAPTQEATLQAAASPTPEPPRAPLSIGALVEVFGTGGDGLRLRASPGLGGRIQFLGLESEVFLLREGPVEVDGFSWWLLENPYDPETFGWAVGDFLRTIGP